MEVSPLTLPEADKDVSKSESGQLFLLRARARNHALVLDDQDTESLATLLRQLDGLPLAIELAAARLRTMTIPDILAAMDRPFELLREKRRDAHARHATLRDTILASWVLLTDVEQAALAALSTFRSGFTLAAARAIVSGLELSQTDDEAIWTTDLLEALVDASLVRVRAEAGSLRYELLESIRVFAAEQLEDPTRTRTTHAQYYAGFGTPESIAHISKAGGTRIQISLVRDLDNLLAAVDHALQVGEPDTAAQAFAAAHRVMYQQKAPTHAQTIAQRILNNPGLSDAHRIRTQRCLGLSLLQSGEVAEGRAVLDAAHELAIQIGDSNLAGLLSINRGKAARLAGDLDESLRLLETAIASLEAPGSEQALALAHSMLGFSLWSDDIPDAKVHLESALALQRTFSAPHALVGPLTNVASNAIDAGNLNDAARALGEAEGISDPTAFPFNHGVLLSCTASLKWLRGQYVEARAHADEALAILQPMGVQQTWLTQYTLARVLEELGMDTHTIWEDIVAGVMDAEAPYPRALLLGKAAVHAQTCNHNERAAWLAGLANDALGANIQTMDAAEIRIGMAQYALVKGDMEQSMNLAALAVSALRRVRSGPCLVEALTVLGASALAMDDVDTTRSILSEIETRLKSMALDTETPLGRRMRSLRDACT